MPGHSHLYCTPLLKALMVGPWVVLGILLTAAVADPAGDDFAARALPPVLLAISIVFAIRACRGGVRVAGDEVIVRNIFSTKHIRRADVEDVALEDEPLSAAIRAVVVTRDGRRVPVTLLSGWNTFIFKNGRVRAITDELRQVIANPSRDDREN